MFREPSVRIDYFNHQSLEKILTHQPLVSSKELNWDGIIFNYFLQGALNVKSHVTSNHCLGMCLTNTRSESRVNGKLTSINSSIYHLNLVPQGANFTSSWDKKSQHIVLGVKPVKLEKFAPESIEAESIELIPGSGIKPDPLITGILLYLKTEIERGLEPDDPLIEHYQNAFLAHLLQNYCSKKYQLRNHNGLAKYKLKLVLDYLDDHLHQKIKGSDIAKLLDISPGYFSRLFKESMGVSLHEYILQRRIETAKKLIKNNQAKIPLEEIAKLSGFGSSSHFCRRFTQVVGINPSKYRDSL